MSDAAFEYRPGLTHLRALSVVLVLLFHAGVITSGYIGVDVFFVLSGFLISSILWDAMSAKGPTRHTLARFYGRRCRRILPLSLLVLVVTAIASHFFFETLVDDWVSAGRAATVWSENWFLISSSNDYFAADGTNPFQQYWSLAVEEQFYVVLPLVLAGLLLVLRRVSERAKLLALGGLAIAGAAAALASYSVFDLSESEFYYSSFTRSYQLLAGVAVMALCRCFGLRDDRRWLALAGAAGLILVAAVLDLSPWWTGLLATGCAVACVLSSRAVLFENRWVELLGVWSYGIYLWHFPINAYLTQERLGTSPATAFAVTFVTATALAAFTYRFFEDPIRHVSVPNRVTFAATGAAIVLVWVGMGVVGTEPPAKVYVAASASTADRVPLDAAEAPGTLAPDDRLATGNVKRVEGWTAVDATSVSNCGVVDVGPSCVDLDGTPKVLLLGDSFANRIYQGLRPLAEEQHWGLAAFARPGCPWMDDVYNDVKNDISDRCARDKHLQEEVLSSVDPDVVVIHSYPYRDKNLHMTRVSTGGTMTQDEIAAAANATVDALVLAGRKVIFVEPTPYAADGSNVDDCLEVARWADECDFAPIDVDSPVNKAMRERGAQDPDVEFVSINGLLCTTQRCSSVLGDMAVMADRTHVSGGVWVKLRDALLKPIEQAAGST